MRTVHVYLIAVCVTGGALICGAVLFFTGHHPVMPECQTPIVIGELR